MLIYPYYGRKVIQMEIKQSQSPISFKELGGINVDMEQFLSQVSELPLDGILGFLSSLSLQLVHREDDFTEPCFQGIYLNKAIVDDFPSVLKKRTFSP